MGSRLDSEDVARLLADRTEKGRAETAAKVAAEYAAGDFSDAEHAIAREIFSHLVQDAAISVRAALSVQLKSCPHLPHDIAMSLARDVEQVSLPILEFSEVLNDDDLVELVAAQDVVQQCAIGRRAVISERVSDALIDTGETQVVATVVANEGAEISETGLTKALEQADGAPVIAERMANRRALPVRLVERLLARVSDRMREHLIAAHDLPLDVASDVIEQSREQATLDLLSGSDQQMLALIDELHRNGRLTTNIVLRALCLGDMRFFEASLAKLANIPLVNARILIHDEGELGLGAAYKKAGLVADLFPIFRAAVAVDHENHFDGGDDDGPRFRRRMIERILTKFDDPEFRFEVDDLEYLMGKLRQIAPIN